MTNFEWLMTLSEEEFTDWVYDQWLHHLQYRWSSSRGGLMIWLKEERAEQTEPQTDCGDFADRLAYERGVKHAWEVAQKVFDSTVTFYEAEDVAKQIADTPQTEQTEPNCEECKHFNEKSLTYMKQCKYYFMECKFEPKTEPQTERNE